MYITASTSLLRWLFHVTINETIYLPILFESKCLINSHIFSCIFIQYLKVRMYNGTEATD